MTSEPQTEPTEPAYPAWWGLAKPAIKTLCLTLIGTPALLATVHGLEIPPYLSALMLILAMAAGYALSQMEPGMAPQTRR